eukprot:TRINITY_DN1552_c0_g3_i2.p1 TRINITY_DN1552_c0_g3~~TRINITY_DN1552_c0_g3_i2.p1  ORF type:complete len:441 (-),score=87.03 TRINITY_DN1552_c0_g3_i2:10-1332(-)
MSRKDKNTKNRRREERKNPELRKKLRKDPGVPKLAPIQQKMIQKLPEDKRRQYNENEMEEKRLKRKRGDEGQLESMVKDANKREQMWTTEEESEISSFYNMKDSSKKTFFKEFRKVVKAADVILEVLDARDPLGSRSVNIERNILSMDPNKKIILVLNKIDLIPKNNLIEWLKYLRNEYPTIAFKASTQQQRSNIAHGKGKIKDISEDNLKLSKSLGVETLMSLLKNYTRTSSKKQAISIGIIGFPNVGKSSIINSLKRSKVVSVGARPGITTTTQEVSLEKNIKLIDCPGIIFSGDMSETDAALRNCLDLDRMDDFVLPIQAICNRCTREQLSELYSIGKYTEVMDFLYLVALKRGKLLPVSLLIDVLHPNTHPPQHPSIHPPIHPSTRPPVHPSTHPPIHDPLIQKKKKHLEGYHKIVVLIEDYNGVVFLIMKLGWCS